MSPQVQKGKTDGRTRKTQGTINRDVCKQLLTHMHIPCHCSMASAGSLNGDWPGSTSWLSRSSQLDPALEQCGGLQTVGALGSTGGDGGTEGLAHELHESWTEVSMTPRWRLHERRVQDNTVGTPATSSTRGVHMAWGPYEGGPEMHEPDISEHCLRVRSEISEEIPKAPGGGGVP
jgi:hypothetical protein